MKPDFKQGDLILFKSENDWLSKAISLLTDSDICHSAMVYSENSIVEAIAPGVTITNMEILSGEEAYVMRLESNPDPAPLLKTADAYIESKTRYDFAGLILLGGLLTFRKLKPNNRLYPVINQIMTKACLLLDEFINHILMHHKSPGMVCSQFVYQVYSDCGEAYQIHIEDGVFSPSKPDHDQTTIRLTDYLNMDELKKSSAITVPADQLLNSSLNDTASDEILAQELFHALSSGNAQNSPFIAPPDKTVMLAGEFVKRICTLHAASGSSLPLDAMFITPGDLAYHAVNLKNMGTIRF